MSKAPCSHERVGSAAHGVCVCARVCLCVCVWGGVYESYHDYEPFLMARMSAGTASRFMFRKWRACTAYMTTSARHISASHCIMGVVSHFIHLVSGQVRVLHRRRLGDGARAPVCECVRVYVCVCVCVCRVEGLDLCSTAKRWHITVRRGGTWQRSGLPPHREGLSPATLATVFV